MYSNLRNCMVVCRKFNETNKTKITRTVYSAIGRIPDGLPNDHQSVENAGLDQLCQPCETDEAKQKWIIVEMSGDGITQLHLLDVLGKSVALK